jgi:hypothetical protein
MLNVGFIADCETSGLKATYTELDSIERHDFDGLFAKVIDEPGETEHSLWNIGLELCFAGEDDNRSDCAGRQKIKKVLHRTNVPKVLQDWVLELELHLEQDLSPVGLLGIGEDPALVVLGFDDEHAEPRNEDVVNLSCAVLQPKRDVIHQVIVGRTEIRPRNTRQQRFATILESVPECGCTVPAKSKANGKCKQDVDQGSHASCAAGRRNSAARRKRAGWNRGFELAFMLEDEKQVVW